MSPPRRQLSLPTWRQHQAHRTDRLMMRWRRLVLLVLPRSFSSPAVDGLLTQLRRKGGRGKKLGWQLAGWLAGKSHGVPRPWMACHPVIRTAWEANADMSHSANQDVSPLQLNWPAGTAPLSTQAAGELCWGGSRGVGHCAKVAIDRSGQWENAAVAPSHEKQAEWHRSLVEAASVEC